MKKIILFVFIGLFVATIANASWLGDWLFGKSDNLGATVLPVYQGGTGAQSFTSGQCLVGNGTGAITTTVCGAAGSYPINQWLDTTNTPTFLGLNASSTNIDTLRVYGNSTTTGTVDASQYCISGADCITSWPSGSGAYPINQWLDTTNTPTFVGLNASSTNVDSLVIYNGITLGGVYRNTWPAASGGSAGSWWATSSNNLIGYPDLAGDYSIVIGAAATTSEVKFEVNGSAKIGTNLIVGTELLAPAARLTVLNSTTTNIDNLTVYSSVSLPNNSVTDAMVADTITASNYLSLVNWFSTTTHANISSLPSLSITESQISDLSHYTDADTGDYLDASTTIQTYFSNAATAFSWGDHAVAGYFSLTDWFSTTTHANISSLPSLSITESQISDLSHYTDADTGDYIDASTTIQTYFSNAATAFSWGNHATAGYLSSSLAASTYLSLTDWFATTTWAGGNSLSVATTLSVATSTPWSGYELAVTGDGVFTGNLYVMGNATSSHFAADEICLNGTCRTTWPTDAGAVTFWEYAWDKTITTTSTDIGLFVTASSTVAADFRVDGDLTTTDNIYAGSNLYLGHSSNNDTDYLYFDAGAEYLVWNNTRDLFVLSNDLSVTGYATTTAGLFTQGNLRVGGNAVIDGSVSATQYCLSGDCITAWPGGGSSAYLLNQWLDTTNTPIFAGLRLTSLADPAGSFLAVDPDGDLIATTAPSLWSTHANGIYYNSGKVGIGTTPDSSTGLTVHGGISSPMGDDPYNEAFGKNAYIDDTAFENTTVIGYGASARSGFSKGGNTVIGAWATSTHAANTIIGSRSRSSAGYSVVIGSDLSANSANSVLIGSNAQISNSATAAIGFSTVADENHSVAIGQGVNTDKQNQFMFGTRMKANAAPAFTLQGAVKAYTPRNIFEIITEWTDLTDETRQARVKFLTGDYTGALEFMRAETKGGKVDVSLTDNFYAGGYASTTGGFFTKGDMRIGGNATTTGSHEFTTDDGLHGLRIIPGSTTTTLDFF